MLCLCLGFVVESSVDMGIQYMSCLCEWFVIGALIVMCYGRVAGPLNFVSNERVGGPDLIPAMLMLKCIIPDINLTIPIKLSM